MVCRMKHRCMSHDEIEMDESKNYEEFDFFGKEKWFTNNGWVGYCPTSYVWYDEATGKRCIHIEKEFVENVGYRPVRVSFSVSSTEISDYGAWYRHAEDKPAVYEFDPITGMLTGTEYWTWGKRHTVKTYDPVTKLLTAVKYFVYLINVKSGDNIEKINVVTDAATAKKYRRRACNTTDGITG